MTAILPVGHALADEDVIPLAALAARSSYFPADLAPRLSDTFAGLCRRAGFEPRPSPRSGRSARGTTTRVALVLASAVDALAAWFAAVPINGPAELETQVVWRGAHDSPLAATFDDACRGSFDAARSC